jgi:hypothetical protein
MSLRHGVKAGELHWAAITMTLGPRVNGQAVAKKLRTAHPPYSFASVEDPRAVTSGEPAIPVRAPETAGM